MKRYNVAFSPEAKEDVKAIQRYLRQFSPKAPVRFGEAMREKLDTVKENPHMYEQYRYQPRYRCIPIEKYLLFYEADDEQKVIYVFRVLHGAQNMPDFL